MLTTRSITTRLILVITVCCGVIFTVIIGYFYHSARVTLERNLEKNARNLVMASVNRVETELTAVGKVAEGVTRALETGSYRGESLTALLVETLAENSGIYGVGAAFEPDAAPDRSRPFVPYFYQKDGRFVFANENDFQFIGRDWYLIARELGKKNWTEPYINETSDNMLMASCSVPFFARGGAAKRVAGVVVADISLQRLTDIVASIKVLKTGYSVLISRNGTIITHPAKEMIMNETIFSLAESRNNPTLRDIGRKMVRGETGFVPYTDTRGVRSWMYYAPVSSTGWALAVVFPEAELFAEIRSLTFRVALIGVVGIVLLVAAVAVIARSITAPLQALAGATEVIASGNFDVELPPVRSADEVGKLTQAFIAMNRALKEYIRNLTETTAAKERIQSELKVATDIQAGLLPRLFPAFPERPEFEIYASMDPAKEVGGDFYDFFFVDDCHLCFLIADVADKGVPAALYMMVAKTLLKSEGQRLGEPDQILANVNNILAADNDSCMFVTVLCAVINVETGELRLTSAGHNPPLLSDAAGVRYLSLATGFVVGPVPDQVYKTDRLTLRPGDTLFLYTDGVTEAQNRQQELFGEERLLEAFRSGPADDPAAVIRYIRGVVTGFVDGAAPSDDVTMVALTYRGCSPADRHGP